MRIYNRDVGPGHPVFIVAEGGSNHGGSLDAALARTDAAADAGADAMKWQLWLTADEMYDREQFPTEHASAERWRLPAEWLPALRDRAHKRGMAFGLSSFGFASLEEADKYVDFHKVASIEAQWHPFALAVAAKRKATLISTGGDDGTSMKELNNSLWSWRDCDLDDVVFLHCTLAYPCPPDECDLSAAQIWAVSSGDRWGLSDHTTHQTIAPCAAVALGACVIEKHIRPVAIVGKEAHEVAPDWPHSLPPYEFKLMVEAIRLTEQALGSSEKRIRPSEEPYLKYRRGPKGLRGS